MRLVPKPRFCRPGDSHSFPQRMSSRRNKKCNGTTNPVDCVASRIKPQRIDIKYRVSVFPANNSQKSLNDMYALAYIEKMTRASKPFDFGIRDELLRDPENAAIYLAEFLESGDMELFQEGLRHVAQAQEGGLARVAEQAALNRGSLYKSLSKNGKPQFETLAKMLAALGLQFTIRPAHQ